jgi:hypothetical protein
LFICFMDSTQITSLCGKSSLNILR